MTKSRIRSILTLVLALALCLSGVFGMENAKADITGVSATKTTFDVGQTSDLSVSFDAAGMGAGVVSWTSSDSTVVSVPAANTGSSMTVTGVAPGTATVTATFDDTSVTPAVSTSKTIDLTVTLKGTVTISPVSKSLVVGGTQSMSVASNTINTTTYPGTYAWHSDNASVATVTANGEVTAVAAGTANITATFAGTNPQVSATTASAAVITVTAPPAPTTPTLSASASVSKITSLSAPYSTVTITLNNSSATFTDSHAIRWTINDQGKTSTNVAELTSSVSANLSSGTGYAQIIAKSTGFTTVTATLTASDGTTLSKSIDIEVDLPAPTLSMTSDSDTISDRKTTTHHASVTLTNPDGNTPANSKISWWVDSKGSNGYDGKADTKVIKFGTKDSSLDGNGKAAAHLVAVNNGEARVYCTTASGVSTYHTVYVSGLSYLPQTGQDMTWVYVLSGVCIALFAAAGIVNARRKKQQNAQ